MPKFQRRLLICLLAAVGLVILLAVYQRLHGINQLKARIHDIERGGDLLDTQKLVPLLIRDADNAVVALLTLTNRLDALDGLLSSAPSGSRLSADGQLTNVFRMSEWPYVDRDQKTFERIDRTNDWNGFLADFALQTNLVAEVLTALARPGFHTGHVARDGFHNLPMQIYMVLRAVEKLLVAGSYYHLKRGELREAHRCLLGLARLIDGFEKDRLLIGQLCRLAIIERTFFAMWQSLHHEGWQDAEMAEWERYWARWDLGEAMLGAAKVERAMMLDYYALLGGRTGTAEGRARQWEQAWDSMGIGIGIERSGFNEYVVVPLWYYVWQEQDCCRSLDTWQRVIGLQKLAITNGWVLAEDIFLGRKGQVMPDWARPVDAHLNWFDEHRFLFSSFSMLTPEGQTRKTMAVSAMQKLVQTVIAIRRYRLQQERLPSALAELEPDFVSNVPLEPLRYRSDEAGWSLYSVGLDGKDDGGVHPKSDGTKAEGFWGGADIIWPAEADK